MTTEKQLAEVEATIRVVRNINGLIEAKEYAGKLAPVVSEALNFLKAFESNLVTQIEEMRFTIKRQSNDSNGSGGAGGEAVSPSGVLPFEAEIKS